MAKVKIPKRVAGVKVPKKVRKQARKAIKATESPVVRSFAAAALGAMAEARAAQAVARTLRNGREPGRTVAIDGDRLAETIRTAALDGMRRFLEGFDEGMRKASRRPAEDEEVSEAPPRRKGATDAGAADG
ncbi:hypothetical protein [Sphingosinicella sp. CPCC 101087]|uniref:hypothetical protein n=1 Tax=Sphingosinicella sp. CPCC 101087 TaxID=2497754 RepID=UPI00101BAA7F|nr:hypothetical protein [Sphingosinicella sp. CPCC 101087]